MSLQSVIRNEYGQESVKLVQDYEKRSRSSVTPSRDDVTLRKAAETAESFVSIKAFVFCDNG